jgi:hypothetical protein
MDDADANFLDEPELGISHLSKVWCAYGIAHSKERNEQRKSVLWLF